MKRGGVSKGRQGQVVPKQQPGRHVLRLLAPRPLCHLLRRHEVLIKELSD